MDGKNDTYTRLLAVIRTGPEYLDGSEEDATPEDDKPTNEVFVSGDLAGVRPAGGGATECADPPVEDDMKALGEYVRAERGIGSKSLRSGTIRQRPTHRKAPEILQQG